MRISKIGYILIMLSTKLRSFLRLLVHVAAHFLPCTVIKISVYFNAPKYCSFIKIVSTCYCIWVCACSVLKNQLNSLYPIPFSLFSIFEMILCQSQSLLLCPPQKQDPPTPATPLGTVLEIYLLWRFTSLEAHQLPLPIFRGKCATFFYRNPPFGMSKLKSMEMSMVTCPI